MARDFQLSIVASFRDKATRGIKGLQRTLKTGWGGSMGRGLAGKGGALGQLVALPTRILGAFASLVPGVGTVLGGLVSSAGNVLGGLVGVVSGVVTRMVKAFAGLVAGFARVAGRVVSAVTGTLKKLVMVAGGIALGTGALIGWQMVKGIRENMRLADVRQALRKLLGSAAKDAEQYARALSLRSPFTPMESLLGVRGIAATFGRDYQRALRGAMDLAAGSGGRLEEAVMAMQRGRTGQFGEAGEALRRMLISRADLERAGAEFGGGGQFMGTSLEFVEAALTAIERRFGGMAEAAAKVGGGPWSTFVGAVQDLRISLTQPWYDRFNTGLSQLNDHLLALGQSETWGRVVAWSERMAEALDVRLRAAIEWLTAQDWRQVWGGFVEGIQQIPAQLGDMVVALTDMAVAQARIAVSHMQDLIDDLAAYLASRIGDQMREISEALTQHVADWQGAQRERWRGQGWAGRFAGLARYYGEFAGQAGLGQIASMVEQIRSAVVDRAAAAPEAGAQRAGARATEQAAFADALARLMGAGAPVTGPMAGGFGAPAAAPGGGAAAAVDPRVAQLAGQAAGRERVAGMLARGGYLEQAMHTWQEATRMREEMEELLPAIVEQEEGVATEIKRITSRLRTLEGRVRRLATGRS